MEESHCFWYVLLKVCFLLYFIFWVWDGLYFVLDWVWNLRQVSISFEMLKEIGLEMVKDLFGKCSLKEVEDRAV